MVEKEIHQWSKKWRSSKFKQKILRARLCSVMDSEKFSLGGNVKKKMYSF